MLRESCIELESLLDKEVGKPIEFHALSTALTLNVIGRAGTYTFRPVAPYARVSYRLITTSIRDQF